MSGATYLFDMGYTLLGPHPSFEHRVVDTLASHGLLTTPDAIFKAESQSWREANERLTDRRFTLDADRSADFWRGFYDILTCRAGVLSTPDPAISEALCRVFTEHSTYALYDDVTPVLAQLRARGNRIGVISNWEGWLHDLLGAQGLTEQFECVIVSGTVGLEKPDPAIFELAFTQMGVSPHECTYVGDSLEYDVAPSLALGVTPVLIDRRDRRSAQALPCRRITSLFELLDPRDPA